VHRLENAGHWPFIDQPEQVWGLLESFFEKVLRKEPSQEARTA